MGLGFCVRVSFLFCFQLQAARGDAPLGYSYPGYVWITPAWYGDRWWDGNRDPEPDSTIPQCTSEDIESVLGRSLAVGAEPPSLGQEVVPIGSTVSMSLLAKTLYVEKLRSKRQSLNNDYVCMT